MCINIYIYIKIYIHINIYRYNTHICICMHTSYIIRGHTPFSRWQQLTWKPFTDLSAENKRLWSAHS